MNTKTLPATTDRRVALLDAAVKQIASKGTRGMRVEEIARTAGVSTALIYHHFGDRSTLLQCALEHVADRANEYTTHISGTAREMLLDEILKEVQDDPDVRTYSAAWGALRDTAVFEPALRPTLARVTQRWVDDIAALVVQGHDDGTISRGLDPQTTGTRLSALAEGISGRWLSGLMSTESARGHLAVLVAATLDVTPAA